MGETAWIDDGINGGLTRLCLVTAVEIEFKTATGLLTESTFEYEAQMKVCRGRFGSRRVTVLKSEMGASGFAERLSAHLTNNRYDALIVAGLAGALDPKLKAGDAIVFNLCYNVRTNAAGTISREKQLSREENASIACDHNLSQFITETLRASGLSCFRGAGVTVDHIVTRARDKISLGSRFNAVAVDMETYDILAVCGDFGLTAAALRVVLDEAESELPDFNRALKPDGQMSKWRTASAMMISPFVSMRFLLSLRRVIDSLQVNLKAILNARNGLRCD